MIKSALVIATVAAISDTPPPGFELWMRSLLYVVGVIFVLVKGINEIKAMVARKPTVDEELEGKAGKADIEKVQVNIAGLITKEKFDDHVEEERLRDKGLEEQISAARHTATSDDQGILSKVENHYEGLKETIDKMERRMESGFTEVETKRSQNIGILHRDLKETEKKVASIEASTESHTRHLSAIQTTMERILQSLPRKSS